MIDSGEAEPRAITGAVRGAIGSAESVDYRQYFMGWQLTRVLRPSLTEKVSPAVVRCVVQQEAAPLRMGSLDDRLWRAGSLRSDPRSGRTASDPRGCGYGRDRTAQRACV
jgi:hypothetical protein